VNKALVVPAALALLSASAPSAAMSCSFGTVVGVAFGSYDVFNAVPLDSTGSISYTCTSVLGGDIVVIDLSKGSSPSYFPRTLVQGAFTLSYNLYLDAARTIVWGDGTSGTGHHGPVTPPEGSPTTVILFGRVPALQTSAQAGSYADTLVATMLF
jgi:spore coat protein U-like protein